MVYFQCQASDINKEMNPMARIDIHRPSAIIPADYVFVGIWCDRWTYTYDATATGLMLRERLRVQKHMTESGGAWAGHDHGGSCHVCGAHAIYLAVFHHPASNEYIHTGMDCAGKMAMGDPERFRRLQDAITAAQKSRAGWKKAEGVLTLNGLGNVWEVFCTLQRPDATTLEGSLRQAGLAGDPVATLALRDLYADQGIDPDSQPIPGGFAENTIVDIVGKLARYGSLSDKQMGFLKRLAQEIADRPQAIAKKAALEAKREEEKASIPDCPEGRILITGTVVKVEEKSNQFGTRWVMTVKSDEGWLVWGTVPRGLDVSKGDRVSLTGTIKRSDKDRTFGFYSRPSGGRNLGTTQQ